jgi:hypothetical protein
MHLVEFSAARFSESPLLLLDRDGQAQKHDRAASLFHLHPGFSWEVLRNGRLRRESKDDGSFLACCLTHHGKPEQLTKLHKGRRAEREDRRNSIHNEVVMENRDAGKRSNFTRDGQLAGCWRAIEKNELHCATV